MREDIQGLRGVAVLLVLLYHSGIAPVSGGYVGVDVFFVISGYLITALLLREHMRAGRISLTAFYARRIRRLLPAATVVMLVTTLAASLTMSPLELAHYAPSAIAAAVYLSNVWFAELSTDYLAQGIEANPLLHTWSLGVEEQFYVVWPLLLIGSLRVAAGRGLARVGMVLAAVGVASFVTCLVLTDLMQPWAFFGLPARAWEFGAGAGIALLPRLRLSPFVGAMLRSAGLALIVAAALLLDDRSAFPGAYALLPVLGAALVIAAGHRAGGEEGRSLLSHRGLTWTGDISYSLYLWHWPILVFLGRTTALSTAAVGILGLSASFGLAWLTYETVENPVRRSRTLIVRAWTSWALGGVLVLGASGAAWLLRLAMIEELSTPEQRVAVAARADLPKVYSNGCHLDFAETTPPACEFADRGAAKTLVLYGDSHAAQWFPALEVLASERGWKLVSLTKSACPWLEHEPYEDRLRRSFHECTEWRRHVIDRLATLKPDLVVVGNSMRYFSDDDGTPWPGGDAAWEAGLRGALADISAAAKETVILRDTPRPRFDAPSCVSRALWRGQAPERHCRFRPAPAADDAQLQIAVKEAGQWPGVRVVDTHPMVCDGSACPVFGDGRLLYRDHHHLSASFARSLAQELGDALFPTHATR